MAEAKAMKAQKISKEQKKLVGSHDMSPGPRCKDERGQNLRRQGQKTGRRLRGGGGEDAVPDRPIDLDLECRGTGDYSPEVSGGGRQ
jgi:hypothetical protein